MNVLSFFSSIQSFKDSIDAQQVRHSVTWNSCLTVLSQQMTTCSSDLFDPLAKIAVLQIRRGNRNNLGIISHISP